MKTRAEDWIMNLLFALLCLVVGLHAVYGCATLRSASGLCDPVVSEVQAIVDLFAPADWQARVDKYIADGHALCRVQAAVSQYLGGQMLTAKAAAAGDDCAAHMKAWQAAHP